MRYFIGTRRGRDGKRVIEYVCIDVREDGTFAIEKMRKGVLINRVQRGEVRNIEEESGVLKTIGDIDKYLINRFTGENDVREQNVRIILNKINVDGKTFGFRLYDSEVGTMKLQEEEAIAYLKTRGGAANAKIVGDKYIASLKGEFETIDVESVEKKFRADVDHRVTINEFIAYMTGLGAQVVNKGLKYAVNIPQSGLKIAHMKLPNDSNSEIKFLGGSMAINRLHVYGGESHIGFDCDTFINEICIDALEHKRCWHVGLMGKLKVNKVFHTSRVESVDNFSIHGETRLVKLGKSLRDVKEFFNIRLESCRVGAVDLSEMTDISYIMHSFNDLVGEVDVKLGKTVKYQSVFSRTKVRLHNFFDVGVREIHGFSDILNLSVADFRPFSKLSDLWEFDGKNIVEFLPPEGEEGVLRVAFAFEEAEITRLVVTEKTKELKLSSLKKLREVVMDGGQRRVLIDQGKTGNEIEVVVKNKGSMVRLPFITDMDYRVFIEDGVQSLYTFQVGNGCKEIRFPKSLQILGRGARSIIRIPKMNIEDTSIKRIESGLFRDKVFDGEVFILPEGLEEIMSEGLRFASESRVYIPESVKLIDKNALRAHTVYIHKGSYADKVIKGSVIKKYVNSVDEVRELITDKVSDVERAKMNLVISADERYKRWKADFRYKKNIMEIIKMDFSSKKGVDPYRIGVEIKTDKFINFDIRGLGDFGVQLCKISDESPKAFEKVKKGKTTDQFNILANLITANTEMYAGAFTQKMLERTQKDISKSTTFMYNDDNSFIAVVRLGSSSVKGSSLAKGIIIVDNGFIKYATVVRDSIYFSRIVDRMQSDIKDSGLLQGVFREVAVGDSVSITHVPETVGFIEIPINLMYNSRNEYVGSGAITVGKTLILDVASGRLITVQGRLKEWKISDIKEYGEYEFEGLMPDEVLCNADMAKMYDILNGKSYPRRDIHIKKHFIVEDLISYINGDIDDTEFQTRMLNNGKMKAKNSVRCDRDFKTIFKEGKYVEYSAYTTINRVGERNVTYLDKARADKRNSGTMTGVYSFYSAESIYKNKSLILGKGEVRPVLFEKYREIERLRIAYEEKNTYTGFGYVWIGESRQIHINVNNVFVGTIVDPLALLKSVNRLREIRDEAKDYGFQGAQEFRGLIGSEVEAGYGEILITAEKIRDNEELTREEEELAAILAYSFQGVFNHIGFEKG